MGEVLCSTENSPFLIIDHIHAKINRVCCTALAIGGKCMNVRKNKLFSVEEDLLLRKPCALENGSSYMLTIYAQKLAFPIQQNSNNLYLKQRKLHYLVMNRTIFFVFLVWRFTVL